VSGAATPVPGTQERLEREREHDRRIADRAEDVWNWGSPAGRRRAETRARQLIEDAALGPGQLALEIGCGTGIFLEKVARSGARIHGMDLSPDLLARAMARGIPETRVLLGDAHRMPYADATFDAVYGSSILHHLDLEAALRECLRVLKPGGRLALAEPNLWNPQIAFMYLIGPRVPFGLSPDEMAFTRSRIRRLLERLGYVQVAVRPVDFLHPAVPARLVAAVERLSRGLERLPLVREIAGSLLIRAQKG
jgi:SAM-dependent methyltransferase